MANQDPPPSSPKPSSAAQAPPGAGGAPAAPGGVPQEIVIEMDWSDEPPPVYANGAQILNSQREFAVVFTDFVGFVGRGNAPKDQPPRAKIVSNVRLHPDVFFQLAAACASNWNKYVNRFVDPSVRAPKFKVIGGGQFQLEGLEPPGGDGG